MEVTPEGLARFFEVTVPHLNEKQRRIVAGATAEMLGRGGKSKVAVASGMSRNTVIKAVSEVDAGIEPSSRQRPPGGGEKFAEVKQPGLLEALDAGDNPVNEGDPTGLFGIGSCWFWCSHTPCHNGVCTISSVPTGVGTLHVPEVVYNEIMAVRGEAFSANTMARIILTTWNETSHDCQASTAQPCGAQRLIDATYMMPQGTGCTSSTSIDMPDYLCGAAALLYDFPGELNGGHRPRGRPKHSIKEAKTGWPC